MSTAPFDASSSLFNVPDATRSYLEGIEKQFHLTDEQLLAITRQFVDDFKMGLGEYNKAMAMM